MMEKIELKGARRLTPLEMNSYHLGKGHTPLSKIYKNESGGDGAGEPSPPASLFKSKG